MWNEECFHFKFPCSITFAKNTDVIIHNILQTDPLEVLFNLPLSVQAYKLFEEVEVICNNLQEKDDRQSLDT